MKILCVSPTYWPAFEFGGPIQSLHILNKALVSDGADITVYTTSKGQSDNSLTNLNTNLDGIDITYFPYSKYFEFMGTTGWHFSLPLRAAIKNSLRQYNIVYILSIWNFTSAITAYYCRKFGIPYIVSPRGQLYEDVTKIKSWKKVPYYRFIAGKILKHASAIHYTSIDEYNNVHNRLGINCKSIVIPNGIPINEYKKKAVKGKFIEKYSHLSNKYILLFLGRMSWKKGIDIVINALPGLLKQNKEIHLVIAGNDEDNYKEKLINIINKLNLVYCDLSSGKSSNDVVNKSDITFTGYLDNVDKINALIDSDLFVLTSHSENFGMSVVEAMACDLPVIISDKVGISADVDINNAGIVINNSLNELTEAVSQLYENEDRKAQLINNAKRFIEKNYDINEISKNMLEQFKQIGI